jgi:hypothetical protein
MAVEAEIIRQRMMVLEDGISIQQKLLGDYEAKKRYESDPRSLSKYDHEIERIKNDIEDYNKSYLVEQKKLQSLTTSENQEMASLLLNQGCQIPSEKKYIIDCNSSIFHYPNIFTIGPIKLPYAVIIGGWEKGHDEYRKGQVESIADEIYKFKLPDEFAISALKGYDLSELKCISEAKCRLIRHDCKIMPKHVNLLSFTFSKIDYLDYLISGERLDEALPNDPNHTFRDKYAPSTNLANFENSNLTNICGVGIFILTRDNKIIISKHSKNVDVYSGVRSYSASGTMNWMRNVHPFDEVARECFEEIGHKVDLENTFLYGFGIDTKKLYFQFSFFEKTRYTSQEIIDKSLMARDFSAEMEYIEAVPFELSAIIYLLKNQYWEPAAAVGLLSLCTKKYGHLRVEKAIDPDFVRISEREGLVYEWNLRSQMEGVSAVMSARYPSHRCEAESQKYVDAVMDFIGNDIDDKDVLEIGCGIGRLTAQLVHRAKRLTCLDISQEMIDRNKKYLGVSAGKIDYLEMFAQDYIPISPHQVVISSLVLIHNIDDDEFRRLVEMMSICADKIFLFEHTDVACQVSPHTRIRSVEELTSAFHGYRVKEKEEYQVFKDKITFLELVREYNKKGLSSILDDNATEDMNNVSRIDIWRNLFRKRLYCPNILSN